MEGLEISNLTRVPKEEFSGYFEDQPERVIAKKDFSILFPKYYINKHLAEISSVTELLCVFMVLDRTTKKYGITLAPIKQRFSPSTIEETTLNDEPYYELVFHKGDVVIPIKSAIVTESHLFNQFETFYMLNNVPAFLNYTDVARMFVEAKKYAGSKIGDNPLAIELITAVIAREKGNEQEYYRHSLKDQKDLEKKKPIFRGLKDISSLDNTASSIIGGYLQEGLIGRIVNPEDKTTNIAKVLKA